MSLREKIEAAVVEGKRLRTSIACAIPFSSVGSWSQRRAAAIRLLSLIGRIQLEPPISSRLEHF